MGEWEGLWMTCDSGVHYLLLLLQQRTVDPIKLHFSGWRSKSFLGTAPATSLGFTISVCANIEGGGGGGGGVNN